MNEALISLILSEVKGECNIPSSSTDSDAMLSSYIREGVQLLTNLESLIDFENDHLALALVKIYVQYRRNQQMNLFQERYAEEIIALQIRYIRA